MARKIGVFEIGQCEPRTYVRKTVACLLVRRLLAEWVIQNVSIRRLAVRPTDAQREYVATPSRPTRANYEHHIEPRFQHFGLADTEWMAWMSGYEVPGA